MDSNFESAAQWVQARRNSTEVLSGYGSSMVYARDALEFIGSVIKTHKPRKILDLGCGDWNWFSSISETLSSLGLEYEGWDACEEMIFENNDKYGSDSIKFLHKDIVTEKYPAVDLIICRDVLFHLQQSMALGIIEKVFKSCGLFVSTSFPNSTENRKLTGGWGFYPINLAISPFFLSKYEVSKQHESLCGQRGNKRYVCMYELNK